MRLKPLATLALMVILLAGCKGGRGEEYAIPKFKTTISANFEVLTGELLGLERIRSISVVGDSLYAICYNPLDKKMFYVIDMNSGEVALSAINEGRGPDELTYGGIVYARFQGHKAYFPELINKHSAKLHSIDIPLQPGSGEVHLHTEKVQPPTNTAVSVFILPGDKILSIAQKSPNPKPEADLSRIGIYHNGSLLSSYTEYPFAEDEFNVAITQYAAIGESLDKLVISVGSGFHIETYSLAGDEITPIATGRFVEPQFESLHGNLISKTSSFQTCGIYATDDIIFVSCNRSIEDPEKESDGYDICVLDWKCRPKMLVHTTNKLGSLFYDKINGYLYAVVKDDDGNSYIGRMTLQI